MTVVAIPAVYFWIAVGTDRHDLSHLNAFAALIPGKGSDPGTDIKVTIVFSCHVFTERAKHGHDHHMLDHHGTRRVFDADRYEMWKQLCGRIRERIENNSLTHMSRSFGGAENLIFVEMADGRTWSVVYCLEPQALNDVRMEVLSAHPKVIDERRISRKPLSYFARKCLFEKRRIPHND